MRARLSPVADVRPSSPRAAHNPASAASPETPHARLLLQHIWAMTQYHADYALQVRAMGGLPEDAHVDREPVARELIAFVLAGCGIRT